MHAWLLDGPDSQVDLGTEKLGYGFFKTNPEILGVLTFDFLSDSAGQYIIQTIFKRTSKRKKSAWLACSILLRRLAWQSLNVNGVWLIKEDTFVRIKKVPFGELTIKFCDIMGTPTEIVCWVAD